MRKLFLVALLALGTTFILTTSPVEARTRHDHVSQGASKSYHALTTQTTQAGKYRGSRSSAVQQKRAHRKTVRYKSAHRKHVQRKSAHAAKRAAGRSGSVSLAGVTPVLAAKAREIASSCGSSVISAVSRRGNRSNHPIGRAVDMRGNPSCIYAHLKGWPGGYSTDYRAAGHVHISYNPGGQEWGLRFAHGGHRHAASRLAGLPRNVYASARGVSVSSVKRRARRGTAQPVQSQFHGMGLHGVQ